MIEGLKPYPEYKDSGLPWLGNVPAHWKLIPNRAIIRRRKTLVGNQHQKYQLLSLTKSGVIVRDVANGKGKFSADMGTSQEVKAGNFVFCLFDVPETPRTVGLSSHDGMITGAYTVFECPNQNLAKYFELFYLAMDDRKLLSPLYSGLRNTIPPPRFLGAKSPQPPQDEQDAIVRFLDHANRRIERFIRTKKKLIALLNEQKQAIIHRAVTRGLDPNVRLKPSGVPWLGDVPEHWEMIPNRALLKINKRVVGKKHKNFTLLSLTLRGIVARDLDNPQGKFPTEFDTYQIVEPNNLVFCLFDIDETPRTVGLSTQRGMITGAYTVFECSDAEMSEFLYLFYLAMDKHKLLRPLYTGLRKVIQKGTFLGIKTPIPPASERRQILAMVASELEGIDKTISRVEREIALLHEYRTRLVADVVTGQLDVRDAARHLPAGADDAELLPDSDELADEMELDGEERSEE